MTTGFIIFLLASAGDPRSTLVVDVAADVAIDQERLREELSLRLPEVELAAQATPGYTLEVSRSCVVDAIAGATTTSVCVAARLVDPLGAELMAETIDSGEEGAWATRQIATLVEGAIRLHSNRLDALLQVIHDSRPPAAEPPPPPTPQAPAGPVVFVDASAAATLFPESAATVFGFEAGAEIAAWRWLHPRLEVGTTSSRSGELDGVSLEARETSLAVLAVVPLPLGPVDLSLGGGFVMCVVAAEAGIQGESVSVHPGARLRAGIAIPIVGRLHGVAATTADVLPRYPEHAWRGDIISKRGAWRLAAQAGLRLHF